MWCAYAFALIALISLPDNIHSRQLLILWISSSFLQLVLLPIIIVGQNIQARAADARAAKTFEDGSKVPKAHSWMKAMAAKMLSDAGNIETARYMWQNIFDESNDKNLKENAAIHLQSLIVDQQVPQLEAIVAEFRRRYGRNPKSWWEMIDAGAFRTVPRDPTGEPYVLRPDGKVVVADPKKLPFIHAGKPNPS